MSSTSSSYLKEFRFQDTVSIITDFTANGSFESLRLNVKYYYEENYARLIRLTDLRKGLKNDGVYVDSAGYEYLKKSSLQENDLLLANVGEYTGFVCLMPELEQHSTLAPNMFLIRFEPFIDSKFMYYLMSGDAFTNAVDCISASSATKLLNKTNLRKMVIHFPELPKQQKIASVLSTVDNLIEQNQNLIDKYTSVEKGMMADLFSRGIDLSGTADTNKNYGQLRPSFDDAPELYQETELGRVPKEWDVEKLENLTTKIIDGTHHTPTYTDRGIPFLRVTDVQTKEINLEKVKFVSEKEHEQLIKRCNPEVGDILYSKNGTIGIPKIVNWDWDFSVFVSLCLIKPAHEKINNQYLGLILTSDVVWTQIRIRAKQGTVTNLHLEEIREFQIPLPNSEEQTEIVTRSKALQNRIDNEKESLDKYKLIKKGLMQDLLTGKVTV